LPLRVPAVALKVNGGHGALRRGLLGGLGGVHGGAAQLRQDLLLTVVAAVVVVALAVVVAVVVVAAVVLVPAVLVDVEHLAAVRVDGHVVPGAGAIGVLVLAEDVDL